MAGSVWYRTELFRAWTIPSSQGRAYGRRFLAASAGSVLANAAWGEESVDTSRFQKLNRVQQEMALARGFLDVGRSDKYKLFNTETRAALEAGSWSSVAHEVVSALPMQGVLCVGEEHGRPLHHAAELKILQALRASTPPTTPLALGMEMFVQNAAHIRALDDFAKNMSSLAELYVRTNWAKTWGYPIDYYADILNYARTNGITIVPLNAPRKMTLLTKMFGIQLVNGPGVPEVDISNTKHRQYFMNNFFKRSAMTELPADLRQRQYEAQTLREEFMAQTAFDHVKEVGGRLMVISGRAHVAGRFGIPDRIHRRLGKYGFSEPTIVLLDSVVDQQRDQPLDSISALKVESSLSIPPSEWLPGKEHADWMVFTDANNIVWPKSVSA